MFQLFPFQEDSVQKIEEFNGRCLVALEMGCISGSTVIPISRAKTGKKIRMDKLFCKFHGGLSRNKHWDLSIPTMVRSLCDGVIRLHQISNILDKGIKKVVRLKLKSGKEIVLTPKHEVCTGVNEFTCAGKLKVGDIVLTNGKPVCKKCGSDKRVIYYEYSKFKGFCRSCAAKMTKKRIANHPDGKARDKDGYVRIAGHQDHPRSNRAGQVLEHHLIMEEKIGRYLEEGEVVHHKNGIKDDNRIENLELMKKGEHARLHGEEDKFQNIHGGKHWRSGSEIIFHPVTDYVESIEDAGEDHVYDIVCEDPHRNFVANGIIVHNCGKTPVSLYYAQRNEVFPCIVVCPASLKWMWQNEASKHFNILSEVLEGTKPLKKRIETYHPIIIINFDILGPWLPLLKEWGPKLVIIDECSAICNKSTKRSKNVKKLCEGVPHILALSGTPLTNRPAELWPVLNLIRPDLYGKWWAYAEKFCSPRRAPWGWVFNGAVKLDILHSQLQKEMMVRKLKKDVLKDLPKKQRIVIPIAMENPKEYQDALRDFIRWLTKKNPAQAKKASRAEQLVKIGYLRRLAGELKLKNVFNWVDDFLENSDGKLILFAIHKSIITKLEERYKKICVVVDGSVKGKDRQTAVDTFQRSADFRLFIGNVKAAGQGLTLTAANTLAFVEIGWTPGEMSQCAARFERIGQTQEMSEYWLIAKGSIEEHLCKVIQRKQKILDATLDGKSGNKKSDLDIFDLLSEQLLKGNKP